MNIGTSPDDARPRSNVDADDHVFSSPATDMTAALAPGAVPEASPAGPITHSLAWATWALFVGIGLMLTGAGLFGTLIAVRSQLDGYGALVIGIISGAYYAGFLAGSRWALKVLGSVGHIRVYAAFASMLSASIVIAGLLPHPVVWILLRFVAGACLAGQYVVAESWLNQLVTNQTRGKLLAFYTTVTVVAFGAGQFWFTQIDPATLTGFGVAATLISLAITPVTLSADVKPPPIILPEPMSLRQLWALVPTGVVTSILVGITHGSFLGLSAVYAAKLGLTTSEIGIFVAMPTLGSLLLSVPVSSLSDRRDRRLVGALVALVAAGAAVGLLLSGPDRWLGLLSMMVIGGMTYPLYSIAGAYTNDWVPTERLTAAASQLVLLFGTGALLGPILGSVVMGIVGADGFAWMTIATHALIAAYLAVRIMQYSAQVRAKPWNAVPVAGRFLYLPVTVVGMGRRLRPVRRRRREGR